MINEVEKNKNKIIVAAIDVGTLKSKFEIREFKGKSSKTLYKDKKLTVLGRDLDKTDNVIVEKSIQSTTSALKEFKQKMDEYHVGRYRAVTTEAIRRARNSREVLARIKKETGIKLKTLSHKNEASILFKSISQEFPNKLIAVADIGGGSVQVVIGENDKIYETHLFKTGTYYLQEEFSKTHHPTKKELDNAIKYIKHELCPLASSLNKPQFLVYGTTNIIDFLQAMNIQMSINDKSKLHPYSLQLKKLIPLYDKIVSFSYEDRMAMYPEEPYYMWAADKALMNVFEICNYLKISKIVPSNNNISTAILYDLANKKSQPKLRIFWQELS